MINRRSALWPLCLALLAPACSGADSDGRSGADDGPAAYIGASGTGGATATGGYADYGNDAYASGAASGGSAGAGAYAYGNMTGAEAPMPAPPTDPTSPGDSYQPVGTNPFTFTAFDPLSTFAADVDTASYDIFVRDIQAGLLPDPMSVRLEEFVNYFSYDYPAPTPDAEHPFAVHLDAAPHPFGLDTTLLRVGIQSQLPVDYPKRPANLVFLVDISGSMTSSDKLPLVKLVLLETLEILDPTDSISIVTYAGSTGVALPPTRISEKATIQAKIESFSAGGSTAGAAGIDLAYQQAESAFIDGGINHVLLCTDGDFNVGPYSTPELTTLIEDKRKTGITLTVLGFGSGNLNDAMMETISNKGNGIYGVINSEDQAIEYVNERMLSNLQLIAKDMKLQVEMNPEHVLAYRLLGYENRAIEDQLFRDDTVDAGEVGAGHQITALYELVLAGGAVPSVDGAPPPLQGAAYAGAVEVAAGDLVLVKVRYKDVDATETDPAFEVASSLTPAAITASADAGGGDLRWAMAVASFAEVLKDSPYARPELLGEMGAIIDAESVGVQDRVVFAQHFHTAQGLLAGW